MSHLPMLFTRRMISNALVTLIAAGLVLPSMWTHTNIYVVSFYLVKDETNQALFDSAVKLLTPLPLGATVFIAGVEPIFNPFWTQPGNTLKVGLKDFNLAVELEKPEAELIAKFCETAWA
jgi:hypothetical protein